MWVGETGWKITDRFFLLGNISINASFLRTNNEFLFPTWDWISQLAETCPELTFLISLDHTPPSQQKQYLLNSFYLSFSVRFRVITTLVYKFELN